MMVMEKEKKGRMTIEKRILIITDIFVRKISKHRLMKTDEKRKSQ